MKLNIKIVILTILIALIMYPKTIEFFIKSGKNIYIAKKLSTITLQSNSDTGAADKTKVVFIFDSGWNSVYLEAYEIMKKYDFKASVSIIPSRIDEKEYMSYEQLSDLYLQGWDLLNHSYTHKEYIYDNSDELLSDFNRARKWMRNRYIGNCSDMLVIPYGEINPYLINQLKNDKYRNVRTSDNIIILDKNNIEYYPVSTINLSTEVNVNQVKGLLKQASQEPKTIIITLSKIDDRDDGFGMTYSKGKLEEIVAFIDEHSDEFEIITYSQLFQ